MPIQDRIREIAIQIIKSHPNGIRYSDLHRAIHQNDNSLNKNTIHGTMHTLHTTRSEIEKPSKGLYQFVPQVAGGGTPVTPSSKETKEESFYEPFARWLKNEVEDVTKAIKLGGNRFKDKWGTPDVIGIRETKRGDIVVTPTEVVVAEIKTNTRELITAFGQACAYCLFSHKSYLVVPKQSAEDEISRLDSLCQVFGIGFVLFDAVNPSDPAFEIRMRPKKQDPDLFYTNKYLQEIKSDLF